MNKLLSFLALVGLSISYQANSQVWTVKQAMPTPRFAPACAVHNNMIYVFGGTAGAGLSTKNERYDPISNSWTVMAPMSTARVELAAATVNGKVYAIGGYIGAGATGVVEEYDPATNTWATKAPMPTPRSVFSVGVINNKIYAVGGWPGQYPTLEEYTPATNTWATKAPLPSGVLQNNGCAVVNNKLYLVAGRTYAGTFLDSVYVYDPAANTWTNTNNNLPQPLFSGAVAPINNKIHHFAGVTANCQGCWAPNTNAHFVYDPATQLWSTGTTMLSSRGGVTAAFAAGKTYVIGGADVNGDPSGTNEEYGEPLTSVEGLVNTAEITIAPNPATSSFVIKTSDHLQGSKAIAVTNAAGAQVYSHSTIESRVEVSTANMAAGVYFVHITAQGGELVKKIIVIK